jgi:hypothetical protein
MISVGQWSTKDGKRVHNWVSWGELHRPQTFEKLVELVRKVGLPLWTQIPYVMAFPELSGYTWRHNLIRSDFDGGKQSGLHAWIWDDQSMFSDIVYASVRTGRSPLYAPDFFFYSDERKKTRLRWMFNNREGITTVPWYCGIKTKKCEQHVDWPRFQQYVKEELPTGYWLFPPEKWDKWWFGRMVVEKNRLEVREEIVQLVNEAGYQVELPPKRLFDLSKRQWSKRDSQTIRTVAYKYWLEWRTNAEKKFEEGEYRTLPGFRAY